MVLQWSWSTAVGGVRCFLLQRKHSGSLQKHRKHSTTLRFSLWRLSQSLYSGNPTKLNTTITRHKEVFVSARIPRSFLLALASPAIARSPLSPACSCPLDARITCRAPRRLAATCQTRQPDPAATALSQSAFSASSRTPSTCIQAMSRGGKLAPEVNR